MPPPKTGRTHEAAGFHRWVGQHRAMWPLAALAQPTGKRPTIGFLSGGSLSSQRAWLAAFVQRLHELGWVEGRNVAIEYRWGEGRTERYAELAAELVRLKVDVIFAGGTEAALAVKHVTSAIPTVFPTSGDPVGAGLVASLARPGGNLTGLSNMGSDLGAKRIGLLREMFPALSRLAVMINGNYSGLVNEMGEVEPAARRLSIRIIPLGIRDADDMALAFEGLKGGAEALYVVGDPLVNTHRARLNIFALANRLPTMHAQREYVEAGGLISYGPNFPEMNRRAADFVDKILRGAKPADIPVEQPTKFDLIVNLITARALALTVPPTLLARADEVIE
jgi:putative ABC transport system substrate-binding protein